MLDQTAAGRLRLDDRPAGEASPDEIEAPYLQLVLERLWKREREQESRVLRAATLVELGGAESIVRAHLEDALGSLAPAAQDVAAAVFNQLVTPSGTKIAHRAADLAQYADVAEPQLRPVLDALGRERILRPVDGAADGGARFEIFHDVLAEAVLEWRARRRLERERQLAQRRHRRLLAVTVSALVALAAVSVVALYALVQRDRAQTQARVAQARELEARALGDLADDPQGSLAAALRASRLEPGVRAEAVLRSVLVADRLRDVLPARRRGRGRRVLALGRLPARPRRRERCASTAPPHAGSCGRSPAAQQPTAALFLGDDELAGRARRRLARRRRPAVGSAAAAARGGRRRRHLARRLDRGRTSCS